MGLSFGSLGSLAGAGVGAMFGAPSVGAAIGGALGGGLDSSNAADAQSAAAKRADQTQRYMYDTTRADNMPALEARNSALAEMRRLLGIGADGKPGEMSSQLTAQQVQAEPGYQFGLQQGQQALQRAQTARGMSNSGQALTAAARYGNDYATTKFGDAWNRLEQGRTNQFNRLSTTAGMGSAGAGTVAAAGQNAANNIAANALGVGNARAASILSNSANQTGVVNQLAGWYANRNGSTGSSGWDAFGASGTNDRSLLSTGNNLDWWTRNGVGAD